MRKTLVLSTCLGAALLAAGPGLAQTRGQSPPSDPVAPLPAQQQAARQADMMAQRETRDLLRQADQAVAAGNWARANELMERAETAWLNQQAMGGGMPHMGTDTTAFSRAEQAIKSRDRNEARSALQSLMAEIDRGALGGGMTGAGTPSAPAYGGGGMMPGRAQPQGGLGTPGGASPYGSQAGTETMPNPLQPGTSAGTNVQGQFVGPRGAPSPGQPSPQAGGSSSQLSTGGQIRPGSPTQGGGMGGGGAEAGGGAGR